MTSEELPEGWATAAVGELLKLNGLFDGPFGSSLKSSDYTPSGVRVIRLENVANLRFIAEKESFISPEKYAGLTKHTVRAGDIIVGSFLDGAPRVCVLPELDTLAIAKADCFCVRPDTALIDRDFLAYQIGATQTVDHLIGEIHGATRPRITTKQLRLLPLLLPPLAEQRRIVAAVERFLDKVTAARARLDRVPTTLKRFRQAVLAAACSGRLTADWRNGDAATPHPPSPANGGDIDASDAENTSAISEPCPDTWAFWSVEDVCEAVIDYRGRTPPTSEAGIPHIRTTQIRDGRIDWKADRFVTESVYDEYMTRGIPKLGDVLFTMEAPLAEVGVVDSAAKFSIAQRILLLRGRVNVVSGNYLALALQCPAVRRAIDGRDTGTTVSGIAFKRFRFVEIPIPPLAEQQEIVKRVSALFARANAIEAGVTAARRRVDTLTQAVLAKAFRGELVPTEAELARRENRPYEPAAELLARIRSTPQAVAKPKRARKAKG